MAYGVVNRIEFKDIISLLWRIDIELDGWTGSISTCAPTDNPLSIELLNNGKDWSVCPIHGSIAKFNIYAETAFQYITLYDYANLTYRVSIYYGNSHTLYWRGFINSQDYGEDYDAPAYSVELTAADGLGQLKNLPFKYTTTVEDDTYYSGRLTEAYIINEILTKIGVTSFQEYLNLYESTMTVDTGSSPLSQSLLDAGLFYDMNCYEVLEHILKSYRAVICQDFGVMCIFRPEEINQATVYGRIFTAGILTDTTSITPSQWVSRLTVPGNFLQPEGGLLNINPPARKVTISQDYGYKKSWLTTFEFNIEDYIGSEFSNWTKSGTNTVYSLNMKLPREKQGILMLGSDSSGYVYQNFGTYALKAADTNEFNISFDYMYYNGYGVEVNSSGVLIKDNALMIKDSTGAFYLYEIDDEFCGWTATPSYITIGAPIIIAVGGTEWQTYTRKVTGLPISGPYQARIYKGYTIVDMVGRAIKNLCFIATADTITKKAKRKSRWSFSPRWTFLLGIGSINYQVGGERKITGYSYQEGVDNEEIVEAEYITSNDLKGVEINNDYIIGDVIDSNVINILEQFSGSIAVRSLGSVATKFVSDRAPVYVTYGQTLTSLLNVLNYQAIIPGVDFTGSTTITNTSGDLSGIVTNSVANVVGVNKIIDITISGSSGACNISASDTTDSMIQEMDYAINISTSINTFISDYNIDFTSAGWELTHPSTNVLRLTAVRNEDFTATATNVSGTLSGSVATYRAFVLAVARIDLVTLSGTSGTANIKCNNHTFAASFANATTPSLGMWSSRQYGGEEVPLIEIIGESIRRQASRAYQMLSLPLMERNYTTADPSLHLYSAIRDSLNLDSVTGIARYYYINGIVFDVSNREHNIELIEIVEEESEHLYDETDLVNTTNLK
jgi:hypothetical protein